MKASHFILLAVAATAFGSSAMRGDGTDAPDTLSLPAARALALKMHPSITSAELRALAAKEVTTEVRAGFFPIISANATAVGTGETVTRLASGTLSNSQIYDHVGVGATVSQLITDFGRTANLTEAAKLRARAADSNLAVVRAQLLLAVDSAYFTALEARAVKAVAAKTLANRQLLFEQITALAQNPVEVRTRYALRPSRSERGTPAGGLS